MRCIYLIRKSFLILLFLFISCKKTISQAEPFLEVMQAIKSNDVNLFKNAFSKKIQEENKNTDWAKNLVDTKASFEYYFGKKCKLNEIEFFYDKTINLLSVNYKGKEQFRLFVVMENNNWKLNER